jgi:hypothetical protein
MDHRSTQPLLEGSLERRSRAVIKGYSTGYYVVTPARYLHEFKDNDDFRQDPTPQLSLYLPDSIVGAIDGVKFNVKGKDVSSGKVGNAFHTTTELSFKAHSASDAEKWWSVIKDSTRNPVPAAASTATSPTATSPTAATAATPTSPTGSTSQNQPPVYAEKEKENAGSPASTTPASPAIDAKEKAPTPGISRTASTASHFHTSPGGSAVAESSEKKS